jgi:hypothetical protein
MIHIRRVTHWSCTATCRGSLSIKWFIVLIKLSRNDPHKEGDPLELYCNVQGFPVPRIYWVVNGKRRPSAPHKLEIGSLTLADSGIYQCFAENEVGTSSGESR